MAQITLNSSGVASSGSLLLQTNGTTTQATVDTSGNMGLGVTPSAWGSPFTNSLEGRAGSAITFGYGTSTPVIYFSSNTYHNGTNFVYKLSSYPAAQYILNNADGTHTWYTAGSGTAGNTISWTQAMTLDASGTLVIGATSGTSGAKLDVNGVIMASNGSAANPSITSRGESNAGLFFGDNGVASYLGFSSGGSERGRFDSSGSFRTYAANPIVTGTSNAANSSTANAIFQGRYGATSTTGGGTDCVFITSNGNIYNTNGTYGTLSDAKLKENIVDATSQWNDIKALRVRNFNFKEGQTHTQIGYIAQEVEAVSPSLVDTSPDFDAEGNDLGTTTKSLKLSVINIKAVKALQEAMERIEQLETRLAALENK